MGVCCCCCDNEGESGSDYGSSSTNRWRRQQHPTAGTASPLDSNGMCACSICGLRIDPILLEGHQEICRTNHRHGMETASARSAATCVAQRLHQHVDDSDVEGRGEEEICIVCLEHLRCFAFLPCGHIACCGECAKQLDLCPLCRQARQGLCYVPVDVLSRYQCKHCQQFIAPTLFDGHREVCGLRMRQAQRDQEERDQEQQQQQQSEQAGQAEQQQVDDKDEKPESEDAVKMILPPAEPPQSTGTSPTTSPTLGPKKGKHLLTACIECGTENVHLVLCLPCGHRVICGDCARKRSTCPVCLQEIRHILNTY